MTMHIVWNKTSEKFADVGESGAALTEGLIGDIILVQKWREADGSITYNVRSTDQLGATANELIDAWIELCSADNKPSDGDIAIARAFLNQTHNRGVLRTQDYRKAA